MSDLDKRDEYVAALRQLADLIEADESLPVPFSSRMQAGFLGGRDDDGVFRQITHAEECVRLRRFAEQFGVDVLETSGGARTAEKQVGPLLYFVHVNADEQPAVNGARIVPASEDAGLLGGADGELGDGR